MKMDFKTSTSNICNQKSEQLLLATGNQLALQDPSLKNIIMVSQPSRTNGAKTPGVVKTRIKLFHSTNADRTILLEHHSGESHLLSFQPIPWF